MKRAILPISLTLLGLGPFVAFFWFMFSTQRDDVATARAFLTHLAAQDYRAAQALMTPELAAQVTAQDLARSIGPLQPWERIGFSSRSTEGFGTARTTDLIGFGRAQGDCGSPLSLRLRGGLVDAFNLQTLCPAGGDAPVSL